MATKKVTKRPETRIEREIGAQMIKEMSGTISSRNRFWGKLNDFNLAAVIEIAIGGVAILRTDHKACYDRWAESIPEGEGWRLAVGPQVFKRIYQRAEELLKPRLEEIDNTRWYRLNFVSKDGTERSWFMDCPNDEKALYETERLLAFDDFKARSLYTATWDGTAFVIGKRVRLDIKKDLKAA